MRRHILFAVMAMTLALSPKFAQADQLSWIPAKTAKQAMACLKPGTVIGYWVVNNDKAYPEILRITSVWADDVESKYVKNHKQIYIEFERLAVGEWAPASEESEKQTLKWHLAHPDGEMRAIDLAYVFTRMPKSLSKFHSLAKNKKWTCDLKRTEFKLPKLFALKLRAKERRQATETAVRAG